MKRCIFCEALKSRDDRAAAVLYRGRHNFILLNRYPYTPGHLMIAPKRHLGGLRRGPPRRAGRAGRPPPGRPPRPRPAYAPQGFNAGMNLGASAGAGVAGHYHLHVVPRWTGDSNFMPLVGATRVFIEDLDTTYQKLRPLFDKERQDASARAGQAGPQPLRGEPMLKTMRRNVKSLKPILWLIVATFIVAIFAIWGGAGRLGEANRSDTLATSAASRISSDEYFQALRARLEAMQKQFGGELNANLIQQLGVPQQTLEQLVQQRLLLQIAADMGLRATDAEVRAKIVAYPAFQQDGQFVGFEEYKRVLDYNHIPLGGFRGRLAAGRPHRQGRPRPDGRHLRHRRRGLGRLPEAERLGQDRVPRRRDGQDRGHREAGRGRAPGPFRQERGGLQDPREADRRLRRPARPTTSRRRSRSRTPRSTSTTRTTRPSSRSPTRSGSAGSGCPSRPPTRTPVLAQARDVQKRAAGGEDFAGLARTFSKDDKAAERRRLGALRLEVPDRPPRPRPSGKLDKDGVSDVVETETRRGRLQGHGEDRRP